jgi:hypothetical protein
MQAAAEAKTKLNERRQTRASIKGDALLARRRAEAQHEAEQVISPLGPFARPYPPRLWRTCSKRSCHRVALHAHPVACRWHTLQHGHSPRAGHAAAWGLQAEQLRRDLATTQAQKREAAAHEAAAAAAAQRSLLKLRQFEADRAATAAAAEKAAAEKAEAQRLAQVETDRAAEEAEAEQRRLAMLVLCDRLALVAARQSADATWRLYGVPPEAVNAHDIEVGGCILFGRKPLSIKLNGWGRIYY